MRENDRNIIRGLAEQYREHCESERNYFDRASEQQIVREYRTLVQDQILKYWKQVAPDRQYGGFITDFDRRWNVRSTDKGAWGQGRLIYSFSETHEHFPEEGWLDLARLGKDFALQHMYAGNGRFYYLVDRTGAKVLDGPYLCVLRRLHHCRAGKIPLRLRRRYPGGRPASPVSV